MEANKQMNIINKEILENYPKYNPGINFEDLNSFSLLNKTLTLSYTKKVKIPISLWDELGLKYTIEDNEVRFDRQEFDKRYDSLSIKHDWEAYEKSGTYQTIKTEVPIEKPKKGYSDTYTDFLSERIKTILHINKDLANTLQLIVNKLVASNRYYYLNKKNEVDYSKVIEWIVSDYLTYYSLNSDLSQNIARIMSDNIAEKIISRITNDNVIALQRIEDLERVIVKMLTYNGATNNQNIEVWKQFISSTNELGEASKKKILEFIEKPIENKDEPTRIIGGNDNINEYIDSNLAKIYKESYESVGIELIGEEDENNEEDSKDKQYQSQNGYINREEDDDSYYAATQEDNGDDDGDDGMGANVNKLIPEEENEEQPFEEDDDDERHEL